MLLVCTYMVGFAMYRIRHLEYCASPTVYLGCRVAKVRAVMKSREPSRPRHVQPSRSLLLLLTFVCFVVVFVVSRVLPGEPSCMSLKHASSQYHLRSVR